MRRGDKTPDQLDRPEGNDLQTNYEKHDVGHAEIVRRLEDQGYEIDDWGIDMRHDDGEDGIVYDDAMDFKVYKDGELVGLLDVKTKSGPEYMGRFNERHYRHYCQHAEEFDVPTFVVMFQVDYKNDEVHDGFAFEILGDDDRVMSSTDCSTVEPFPDRNEAVAIKHEHRRPWKHVLTRLAVATETYA